MFQNPSLPSQMTHSFSRVPAAEIQRSVFDRTHTHKTTFDGGMLFPVMIDEVLPGDTFNCRATFFARLATPLKPFMDNLVFQTFFFFVPNRLIWDNWEKFNGQQTDPGDSTDFLVPQMVSPPSTGYTAQSLSDYMAIPTGVPGISHCSFWHRAYNLIWNEWFRDQNLQDSLVVDRDDGPDSPTDYVLQRINKRHDYFTSCLPWPQKGPSVALPLTGDAPVLGIGKYNQVFGTAGQTYYESDGTTTVYANAAQIGSTDNLGFWVQGTAASGGYPNIRADLSDVTAATINALRQAFAVQRLYERDARGGTRYTEIIRAHFGVVSPDARLQRPEYLGGGLSHININPVAQTSSTDNETPQGNLSAVGTMYAKNHGFVRSFTEHGVIVGLAAVRADLTYQQGLNRMFSRSTRFDFYWPALSHIGEQAVLNKEIYAQGTGNPTADAAVFGYQERFAEYRYKPSIITGKFRSTDPQSLDYWHLAQEFSALPELNEDFIKEVPPIDRVVAVTDEPEFLLDSFISMRCTRPMPVYSVPGLIDHF